MFEVEGENGAGIVKSIGWKGTEQCKANAKPKMKKMSLNLNGFYNQTRGL